MSEQENLVKAKQELRKQAKAKLAEICADKEDLYARQAELIKEIELSTEFKKAKTILSYYPIEYEFDLSSMIISNPNKQWVLPRAIGGARMLLFEAGDLFDLIETRFKVKAPPATNSLFKTSEIDLVLVPGLAFSKSNQRLGRGGAYYDSLLAELKKSTKTIGVCPKELVWDELASEDHDIKVKKVLAV